MKFFKQILVTFFTAIVTVVFVYGGYTIYAAEEEKINFRTADTFYTMFDGYHGEMNEYFNNKINKMVTLVETPDFYQNAEKKKQFLPPANLQDSDDVDTIIQKCGDNNFSSYCVGIGALKTYKEYLDKLNYLKNNINLTQFEEGTFATEILRSKYRDADEINKESQEAKAVMEATVAAYNEFRLAYPMHIKYQEILKQLTKYKLILKDVRLNIAKFPVRFVDASTSKCE